VTITRIGRIRLLALSIAGAVCGHTLAYALSFPDRMSRQSVLRVTGHAYWHGAIAAAGVGAVWFALSHGARHISAGRSRRRLTHGAAPTMVALTSLQVSVFIGMEITERLASGVSVATVLDHHILAIGLAVQIVVAVGLTLGIFALGRAAHAIGRWATPRPLAPASGRVSWSTPAQRWPSALPVVPCGSRGPPTL
jgi:hypothetical protein